MSNKRLKNKILKAKNELLNINDTLEFEALESEIKKGLYEAIDSLRFLYDNL